MICSVVQRSLGFGSSIARMRGRQARGERLEIVAGLADWAGVAEAQAAAYAAYRESLCWAARQGIS